MKIKPLLFILAGSLFLLSACYENESVYYDQLDVTLTEYDTEFDFSSYTSFWISDSAILKTNFMTEAEVDEFYEPGGTSDSIVENVKKKFIECGYDVAADSLLADFIATPTILMMKTTGAIYYPPGWWWGYPGYGWGYPGWGYPGYPWNPGYVSYYSYKTGTIIIEMLDGDSFQQFLTWQMNPTADVPDVLIRWMGAIDGYISNNAEYNEERANRGLDEAFDQSPYLKK